MDVEWLTGRAVDAIFSPFFVVGGIFLLSLISFALRFLMGTLYLGVTKVTLALNFMLLALVEPVLLALALLLVIVTGALTGKYGMTTQGIVIACAISFVLGIFFVYRFELWACRDLLTRHLDDREFPKPLGSAARRMAVIYPFFVSVMAIAGVSILVVTLVASSSAIS